MKKLLISLCLFIILLGGCSSESSTPKTDTSAGDTLDNSFSDTNTDTSTDTSSNNDLKTYADDMTTYTQEFTAVLSQFSDLNKEASEDPLIMSDPSWIKDMATNLVMMAQEIKNIREVTPPDSLSNAHDIILSAMDEFQFIADNYPKAIDNADTNLMMECAKAMGKGSDLLQQATQEIQNQTF